MTADRFGIAGLPILILFKDGRLLEHLVGSQLEAQLLNALRPRRAGPGSRSAAPEDVGEH